MRSVFRVLSVLTRSCRLCIAGSSTASTPAPAPAPALAPAPAPAPAPGSGSGSSSGSGSGNAGNDVYKMYTGDGSSGAGWPDISAWIGSFDTMWNANLANMKSSCQGEANNSDAELADLKAAIQAQASSTGIDARFALAIMMQESGGCVRVVTTNYGVRNPGKFLYNP